MAGSSPSFGQAQRQEPTESEITAAYRKGKWGSGENALIPSLRWEAWRIKEIRGWSLKFKRISGKRNGGVVIRKYLVTARETNSCAEYQITDTFPIHQNAQIKPILNVEFGGVKPCQ